MDIECRLDEEEESNATSSGSEYEEEEGDEFDVSDSDDGTDFDHDFSSKYRPKQRRKLPAKRRGISDKAFKDDGNEEHYAQRIRKHRTEQELCKVRGDCFDDSTDFYNFCDEFHVSKFAWDKLYKYQKTGIRWLCELHNQYVGGILADEMGLGKTIQLCVFLRSLSESHGASRIFRYKGLGPSLILCPATLLHQWVKELNTWFPMCKVAVLHSSGAHSGPKSTLIRRMGEYRKNGSILITSYSTYVLEYKQLLKVNWHYVILDEGHKIRNPEAKITLTLKELRTPHRLILSGSPMQNNFRELWSLIDFIYPGRLGSLKEFMEKFSVPITQGGYANATAIQVRTAYKTACVLRDAISPYLLRRMKKDVQMVLQLPDKTEQILFCEITSEQRRLYLEYIESKNCEEIITGKMMPFVGLMFLRKLCNHPDLVTGGPNRYGDFDVTEQCEMEYGFYQRSGKMIVLRTLLRLWFEQGHKVLLFSQSRQMLTIIERFVLLEGYEYLRMDGTTAIGHRQTLVEKFNTEPQIFIFLLTTKVGGLGINLTGANRVLIFDPDWNPSTDAQARERAWRIGQNRAVTIYRLLTSGTIEEKIYQRQIFKYLLTNRVLDNPKQQRFFKTNDLHELFTLGSSKSDKKYGTETAVIFAANETEITKNTLKKSKKAKKQRNGENGKNVINEAKRIDESLREIEEKSDKEDEAERDRTALSDEARERLRRIARQLAAKFEQTQPSGSEVSSKTMKKKKRKVLFEGKYEIPLLKKQVKISEKLEEQSDENNMKQGGSQNNKEQDDYVLNKLLRKNVGVHSALRHDNIIKEGSAADIQLIEDEANAVAKRAADVLKRSRRAHKEFLENASEFGALAPKAPKTPLFGRKRAADFEGGSELLANRQKREETADSRLGEAEDDEGKLFDGTELLRRGKWTGSGTELLKSIRQRKERQLDIDSDNEEAGDETSSYPSLEAQLKNGPLSFGDRHEKLADEIRRFLAVNNGRASTNELLSQFKNSVHPSQAFVFRSILKRLCRLLPNSQWILRDEYA